MFDWSYAEGEDDPQLGQKELKRKQLVEVLDHINENQKALNEANMPNVMEFVSVNIFRGFPAFPNPAHVQYDPEEDEPIQYPEWPHLQLVMEVFLRFVVSNEVDPKVARKYIDQPFITKLLALFDSEDERERETLKMILHRIYGKFMQHRAFIRKSINNTFYHFVYNTERHNGISELLEILGSIINGFALPLKDEHKFFLRQALMPLHKVKYVSMYHTELAHCISQFCMKDRELAPEIILGILKFWPQTNSPKELLYLQEIETILEQTGCYGMDAIIDPLFSRINRCIMSYHFQVSERALFLWHNERIFAFISDYREQILPIVFPGLMANTKGHWNATVHQLSINVVKMCNEMDPELFERCAHHYKRTVELANEKRKRQSELWHDIETVALTVAEPGWQPPSTVQPSLVNYEAYDVHGALEQATSLSLNLPKALNFAKPRGDI
eukprot:c6147_g1_i2.p1 GENE.c6147_g1_i2~~c6147_g1_i2.p1  ORF type:complete len:443 (-),score=87.23 c6147_g1_i2:59-1387(-)